MAVVEELIRKENNGTISFGNYQLATKSKLSDFQHDGDLYKVKTYQKITKLERNGLFVYESVPGTSVFDFKLDENELKFKVEGTTSSQITLELEPEQEYTVAVDQTELGNMRTNLGGKLVISLELSEGQMSEVLIARR